MWKTIMLYLVKGAVWAAKHPDDVKTAVDVIKAVKGHKPSPPPVVVPAPLPVGPVDSLPAPVAPPPPPPSVWTWNANNVFAFEDLNKLAAQTGIARDTLAETRDAYLAGKEAEYRAMMAVAGRGVDSASAAVLASDRFRAFLQINTAA